MSLTRVPDNPEAPHTGVVYVYAEVHELKQDGSLAGRPVHKIPRFVLPVEGKNRQEAIEKMNKVIAEVKKRCRDL